MTLFGAKKTIRDSFVYLSSSVLIKILGFLFIPIYTNNLTPEEFGKIDFLTILGTVFLILFTFGFNGAYSRLYFDYVDKKGGLDFLRLSIFKFVLIFGAAGSFVFIVVGGLIWDRVYENINFFPLIIMVLIGSLFRAFLPIHFKHLQNQGKSKTYATIDFGYNLSMLLLSFFLVIIFKMGVFGFGLSYFVIGLMVLGFNFKSIFNSIKIKFDLNIFKESIEYAFPVLITLLTTYVYTFADRIIISKYLSFGELGIYSLGAKFSMILIVIQGALTKSLKPMVYEKLKFGSEDKMIKVGEASRISLMVMGYFGFCLSIFSFVYIDLFVDIEYQFAKNITPILILGYIIQTFYHNSTRVLYYLKKAKIITYSSIITGAFNIGVNILVIPEFGIIGVAWTTVASFALSSVFLSIAANYYVKIPNKYFGEIILLIFYIILTYFLYIFDYSSLFQSIFIKSAIIILIGLFLLLKNRHLISKAFFKNE